MERSARAEIAAPAAAPPPAAAAAAAELNGAATTADGRSGVDDERGVDETTDYSTDYSLEEDTSDNARVTRTNDGGAGQGIQEGGDDGGGQADNDEADDDDDDDDDDENDDEENDDNGSKVAQDLSTETSAAKDRRRGKEKRKSTAVGAGEVEQDQDVSMIHTITEEEGRRDNNNDAAEGDAAAVSDNADEVPPPTPPETDAERPTGNVDDDEATLQTLQDAEIQSYINKTMGKTSDGEEQLSVQTVFQDREQNGQDAFGITRFLNAISTLSETKLKHEICKIRNKAREDYYEAYCTNALQMSEGENERLVLDDAGFRAACAHVNRGKFCQQQKLILVSIAVLVHIQDCLLLLTSNALFWFLFPFVNVLLALISRL